VFWHLDTYPNRAAADAQKGPRGTVIEALGRVWLFTIGAAGWRPAGGVRVAQIGPLLVKPGEEYTAGYLEAIFSPGMTTIVHRHPGPEAFYTTAGEVCLETPDGKIVGGAGASTIVPAGRPMQLTATGTEQRRSVACHPVPNIAVSGGSGARLDTKGGVQTVAPVSRTVPPLPAAIRCSVRHLRQREVHRTVLVTDTGWRFKIVGVNSQCIPASPGVRRKRVVRERVAKSEMLTGCCPFLALWAHQRPANASKRRHTAKGSNRRILGVIERDPAASSTPP